MKFRWLGFLISGFAFILSFSTVNAECSWNRISCSQPEGSGATITFNSMDYAQNKYFWNTDTCVSDSDLGTLETTDNGDCILWRGQSVNGSPQNTFTDEECISFGQAPYENYGCPCLEPTCVVNYVNGDNRIKEPYFASARKCLNGSCASRDPLGYFPETPNYEPVPTYEHSLSGTAALGDTVRVQVYSHDNAIEQFPGDPNYNNYMAHDTDIKLSWNNTNHTAQGIVSSVDATPVTKTSPAITLPALPSGMQYEVVGVWHHYNSATTAGSPNYVAEHFTPTDNELSINGTTATFNLGDHASSFGNVHRTYFDLQVVQTPITDFTITKSANPDVTTEMHPGETITYSITATNTGNTVLPSFTATDSLNSNLTFVSGDTGVSHVGQTVTLDFDDIAIGASATKSFIVSINTNIPTPTQVCNQASSTNSGITHASENVCHTVTDPSVMDFSLTKSANPASGSHVEVGDTITYTVSATNTGNITLSNVIGTDTLDSHLTFVTGESGISHVNGIVTIQFTNIAPGVTASKNFQVVVNSMPTPPWISNTFSATVNGITKTSNQTTHYIDTTNNPDFTLTKTANPDVTTEMHPEETITYSITATNTGNTVLPSFTATDSLNSNLTFVSGDTGVSHVGQTVTLDFDDIAIGASATKSFIVSINTNIPTPTQVCNQASSTNSGITHASENVCHTVTQTPISNFFITKSAIPGNNSTVTPGDIISYGLHGFNTGNVPLTNLVITDVLNPNVEYAGSTSSNVTYDVTTHTVTVTFDTVPISTQVSASFTVKIKDTASTGIGFCNEATGTANNLTETSNSVCHYIVNEEVSLTKTADIPAGTPVDPGQILTYTISATNNTADVLNIVVTDPLDPLLQYVGSADPNVTYNAGTHTVSIIFNNVAALDTVYASFQAEVLDPGMPDTEVCNEVSLVSANSSSESSGDLWDTITNTVKKLFSPVKNLFQSLTSSVFDIRTLELLTANSLNDNQGGGISAFIPERICHPITQTGGSTLLLEKTSDPAPGSTVTNGDTVLYKVQITNNSGSELTNTILDPLDTGLSFIAPGSISSSDSGATGTISFDTTTSLLSLSVNNLGNGEWMMFEFSTEVGTPDNIQICNQANITDLSGQMYESENICLTVDNGGTGGNTFIEKSVSPTGTITNGDTLTYTIRMTSDETDAFSTLINDTLDDHLIYLGNELITTENTSITGSITHDGNATGGLVELTVNDLANGWIEFSFDVLVEGIGTSSQICNQATEKDGNWFSNIVCSSTENGSGGGGQTISTIGICTDLVNGSVTCRKHTPHPSFGEEAYQAWKECKKNASKEDLAICTHDWAAEVGLLTIGECHPDNVTSNQTIGRWNPYNGYYVWNGGLSDEDNECNTPIPEPCTPCNEIEATITKTTSTPAVAKEENAHYTTILSLKKTEPANIRITGIKVYDLTIPAKSGWIYNHKMAGNSEWEWKGTPEDPASNYFKFSGESFDLTNNKTFVVDYDMDTALTIRSDTAQVKNVAFAVIEYQIEQAEGGWSNPSTFYVGNPDIEECQDLTILDIINASTSTLGTTATVKIIRPFVEVRGGGNVGVQKLNDTTENPFGGLQTGGEFEDTLSTGEILTGEETNDITTTENLWDTYKEQTSETKELLGTTWQTTPDNTNVYFTDGNVTLTTQNAQDLTGTSKTFVINGTLTITENFEPTAFAAFIADQISIDKDVEKMIGVFIADPGKISSPEISYKQLVVSGSLMGDATDLLAKRKFIGEHPETLLAPSIKINYDLRLLDDTPPALELFLSEDWTQSTEE